MQRVQPLTQPIKHGGELRKQQDLMTVFRHRLAQFHAGVQLARWTFIIFKAEPRVAAYLPQPGQRGENLQFALLVAEICNGGLHTGIIELLLILRQRNLSDIFFLGRKFLEDIFFSLRSRNGCTSRRSWETASGFLDLRIGFSSFSRNAWFV